MCEFCTKHGDGKRWYLQAKNYSDDMLSDARRRSVIEDIAGSALSDQHAEEMKERFDGIDKLDSLPRPVRALASWLSTRKMKRDHFGQVVPIEDIEEILKIVGSIVRLPCACRRSLRGNEHYYCLGVSIDPDFGAMRETMHASAPEAPDVDEFEQPTPEEALALMRDWEKDGLVHTVWTFRTPFIGGICNCDRSDCMAMVATVGRDVKVMFRAEFVAEVNWDLCTGCRSCMRVCQFGAVGYSAANEKAFVDLRKCYGCGLCRSVCPEDAVHLVERSAVPEAAKLW